MGGWIAEAIVKGAVATIKARVCHGLKTLDACFFTSKHGAARIGRPAERKTSKNADFKS
jgi:hypothetical protein